MPMVTADDSGSEALWAEAPLEVQTSWRYCFGSKVRITVVGVFQLISKERIV